MRGAIAISCVLIAASSGAGFALSAMHKVAFSSDVVASLSTPVVEEAPRFVIPQYVPARAVVQPEAPAPAPVVAAVVEFGIDMDALEPAPGQDVDVIATVPHLDVETLNLPSIGSETSQGTTQAAFAPARVAPANAPVIVTQVSTQNRPGFHSGPEYSHGVFR